MIKDLEIWNLLYRTKNVWVWKETLPFNVYVPCCIEKDSTAGDLYCET